MPEQAEPQMATLHQWLANPMEPEARRIVDRVRRAQDVAHVAVMPDVHPATDVCVGMVMATRRLLYPGAVGGDIGCGMLALAFDAGAQVLQSAAAAGALLRRLGERIPARRRHRTRTLSPPESLSAGDLSHPSLIAMFENEGRLQLGTLGGGNHFVELQSDADDRLWLMIHSGSRVMGQAIRAQHLAQARIRSGPMQALDAGMETGAAYLRDQQWARTYAQANRSLIAQQVIEAMRELFNVAPLERSTIACDHNHVRQETHFGESFLVHRKGAMPADAGLAGVAPGSMGTHSYHVEGRGCDAALRSSAHGAGRLLSRHAARERFTRADLRRQMEGVWFDPRLADALREETPKAYKNIQAVLRAQQDLVRITRVLQPRLIYKGG